MKKLSIILTVLISTCVYSADSSVKKIIIEGVLKQKTDQGIIIECINFPYNPPVAIKGSDPKKNQAALDKYNKLFSERTAKYARGTIMLQDLKNINKIAKGDAIKTMAIDAGVVDFYTINGDKITESLHVYKATDDPVKE